MLLFAFIIVSLMYHFHFHHSETFNTFNSQVSARPEDWQSFRKFGQESLCVVCRFHACWCSRQLATLSKSSKSYWFDKLWLFNHKKFTLDRIIPSSWASQRGVWSITPSRIFMALLPGILRKWRSKQSPVNYTPRIFLAGTSSLLQEESRTSTFFLLFYSCLVYFILVLFALYQKHINKLAL